MKTLVSWAVTILVLSFHSVESRGESDPDLLSLTIAEYKNEFRVHGYKLELELNTQSKVENATYQVGPNKTVRVILYGGLWLAPEMNDLGRMIAACHELGHIHQAVVFKTGIASEGDADYFATSQCAPRVLRNINTSIPPVSEFVSETCSLSKITNRKICEYISVGALAVGQMRARIYGQKSVAFETPDLSVVTETNGEHLSAQCSLDTYFAGSLGNPRPACWYK